MNIRNFPEIKSSHLPVLSVLRIIFSLSLKSSSNHNMKECIATRSPFVGYSNLPYIKPIFTTRAAFNIKNRSNESKSDEIMPLTAEITHKLLSVRRALQGGFTFVMKKRTSGIDTFRLPAKKLLFDILKNLVTFTASNHCMYGGKRYN